MHARVLAAAVLTVIQLPGAAAGQNPPRPEHEVTAQELVYQIPGMADVRVEKDVPYKKTEARELKLDLYYPKGFTPSATGTRLPAVVFINGVGDPPGAPLKEWGVYGSWGRLIAASGWIAVTFDARGPYTNTAPDIRDLFRFLRSDGARLGIRTDRIAAWVCSGNVFSGLRVLMEDADPGLRAAVVYYGPSEAPKIRTDLPVLFVRAGRDSPRLNASIDKLLARVATSDAPWTVVYAPDLHHAFDVLDETPESRRIVRETLEFYRELLSPREPSTAPSQAKRALAHWFAGEYDAAAAAYGDYVKSHPDDAIAYMRLGLSQAHQKRPAQAEANLQKAVQLGADSPTDLYNVACGYALLGNTETALDWLERAVARGFRDGRLLSSDDDLASLRESERFKRIAAALAPQP